MELSQRIEELEGAFDALFVQHSLTVVKETTLTAYLFGVWRETLPADQFWTLRENYLNEMDARANQMWESLRSIVPEKAIRSAQFDFLQWMQRMRADLEKGTESGVGDGGTFS